MSDATLAQAILEGHRPSLARAIRIVENGGSAARDIVAAVYSSTGRARTIGVTGPPGVGKSTLVDRLIAWERGRDRTVGVIAVDPSSPFTGGAILGDRIRMGRHWNDSGVFVRSMATRGHLGGMARSTREVIHLLDAYGFDTVIVETVGVGQAEIDVAMATMSTVVVLAPGLGDAIQCMKAGLMEVADVFVVNQADRPGADALVAEIRSSLDLLGPRETVEVLTAIATEGEGLAELGAALDRHRAAMNETGGLDAFRKSAAEDEIRDAISADLLRDGLSRLQSDADAWIDRVAAREVTVRDALAAFLGR